MSAASRLVAFALGVALLVGCTSSQYQIHATVAAALDEASQQAHVAVRERRQQAQLDAATAAHARGEPEETALAEAARAASSWQVAIDAHATADRAVRVYIRGVLLAGEGLSLDRGLALFAPVVEAWQGFSSLVSTLSGGSLDLRLPDAALPLLRLLPSQQLEAP